MLINQSGRGDKDIFTIAEALRDTHWRAFLRDKVTAWERGGAPA
jgi:tryptophan synthase beta chain